MTNKKLILTSCLVLAIALAGCGAKDKKVETPEVIVEQADSTIKQSEQDDAALADTMDSTADIEQENTDTNEAAEETEEQVEKTVEQTEDSEEVVDAEEYLSDKNIALNKDEMKRLGNGQDFLNTHLKDTTWKLYCAEENNEYEYNSDSSTTITATFILPDKVLLDITSNSVGNMSIELDVIANDDNIKIESGTGEYIDVEAYLDNNGIQWLTLTDYISTMWLYKDTTDEIIE